MPIQKSGANYYSSSIKIFIHKSNENEQNVNEMRCWMPYHILFSRSIASTSDIPSVRWFLLCSWSGMSKMCIWQPQENGQLLCTCERKAEKSAGCWHIIHVAHILWWNSNDAMLLLASVRFSFVFFFLLPAHKSHIDLYTWRTKQEQRNVSKRFLWCFSLLNGIFGRSAARFRCS